MRRYVIVGNGAAGASAAFTARELDADADITIVGGEAVPFYSRPGLAYLLTGSVPERQLFSRPDRLYQEARIRRLVATVSAIEPEEHRIRLEDGRTLPFDRLLVATGARATLPDLPGIGLTGVVTLDSLAGTRDLIRLAAKARRACVVGGGITALELAEGLAARGVETHYLMRGDRYWSTVLDPAESRRVEHHLAADGIRVRTGVELEAVLERSGRVAGVRTSSGETIACDLLGVAIGVVPRTELASAAGIPVGRGISVSDAFATELPDVLAAGDCAEVLDPATGRRSVDALWSVANEHGRVAGANLAGGDRRYTRPAPFNVTRIGGITTTIIGQVGTGARDADLVSLSRGDSFAWREQLGDFAVGETDGDSRLRIVLGPDRIAGAIVMGDQSLSRTLQHLIRERVDVSAVRDSLLDGSADLRVLLASLLGGTLLPA
jgi:NADPH-dependent 2,4-dienoyl-CoA reductase/sulfur reductase-like enzyme